MKRLQWVSAESPYSHCYYVIPLVFSFFRLLILKTFHREGLKHTSSSVNNAVLEFQSCHFAKQMMMFRCRPQDVDNIQFIDALLKRTLFRNSSTIFRTMGRGFTRVMHCGRMGSFLYSRLCQNTWINVKKDYKSHGECEESVRRLTCNTRLEVTLQSSPTLTGGLGTAQQTHLHSLVKMVS